MKQNDRKKENFRKVYHHSRHQQQIYNFNKIILSCDVYQSSFARAKDVREYYFHLPCRNSVRKCKIIQKKNTCHEVLRDS